MSKVTIGITGALVIAVIAFVVLQSQSRARLRRANETLRLKADQAAHLNAENERLSNSVGQFRLAQQEALVQFQELLKLRTEVKRLQEENKPSLREETLQSNLVELAAAADEDQEEIARLVAEVARLTQENQEIDQLREEIRQLQATNATPVAVEPTPTAPAEEDNRPPVIRMIAVEGNTFPDKLKRAVAAGPNETFQDVFARFLQSNGVAINTVAGAVFSQSTGRVIVRGPQATLDQIEKVTRALDQAQE